VKVWAVSAGSYSDYHVEAIFERREDADAYAEARNPSDVSRDVTYYYGAYYVEDFDYYPAGVVPALTKGQK
jgi:hypothetical protein